ncbi:MAG: YfhO family protein [Candidatus Riflebacteria bacterium]|nr:YfhO family protein [Candidatus Riflebacteria bacterium]
MTGRSDGVARDRLVAVTMEALLIPGLFAYVLWRRLRRPEDGSLWPLRLVIGAGVAAAVGALIPTVAVEAAAALRNPEGGFALLARIGGPLAALIFALAAGVLIHRGVRRGCFSGALVALGAVDLWYWLPRGCEASSSAWMAALILTGLVPVALVDRGRWRLAAVLGALIAGAVTHVGENAVRGLPRRREVLPETEAIRFLKQRAGHERIHGVGGALFPNLALAHGLNDVRYLNSLSVRPYSDFVLRSLRSRDDPTWTPLWFPGVQEVKPDGTPLTEDPAVWLARNLAAYSYLGVRYVAAPVGLALGEIVRREARGGPSPLVLVHTSDAAIWENRNAAPRARLSGSVRLGAPLDRCAPSGPVAAGPRTWPARAPPSLESLPELVPISETATAVRGEATISADDGHRVVVRATCDRPALLMLADVHYPGWRVDIDGRPGPILRVDGLFRGVELRAGSHDVTFTYGPAAFHLGLVLAGLSLFALLWMERRSGRGERRGFI